MEEASIPSSLLNDIEVAVSASSTHTAKDKAAINIDKSDDIDDININVNRNVNSNVSGNVGNVGKTRYISHFSLRHKTSTIRFKGARWHVFDADPHQFILEEMEDTLEGGTRNKSRDGSRDKSRNKSRNKSREMSGDVSGDMSGDMLGEGSRNGSRDGNRNESRGKNQYNKEDKPKVGRVMVKRVSLVSHSQFFLRLSHGIVVVLFLAFLLVLCFQVLLFLVIALPSDGGFTSQNSEKNIVSMAMTALSFPIMLQGMVSLMSLGSAFLLATYKGLLFGNAMQEVVYVLGVVLAPALTYIVTMLLRLEEPWAVTARVWMIITGVSFAFFVAITTLEQMKFCFYLVERFYGNDLHCNHSSNRLSNSLSNRLSNHWSRRLSLAHKALLISQTARYSATRQQRYLIRGNDNDNGAGFSQNPTRFKPDDTTTNLYSRIATHLPLLFRSLSPPQRIYSPAEIREDIPIITRHNFSLQGFFCSCLRRRRTTVVITRGPSALTPSQIRMTIFGAVAATILTTLLTFSAVYWNRLSATMYLLATIICVVAFYLPLAVCTRDLCRMRAPHVANNNNNSNYNEEGGYDDDNDDDGNGEGNNMFHVWETVRIAHPKIGYCYARIAFEIIVLFVLPFLSMMIKHNFGVAVVFLLLGNFTFTWQYFDYNAVLSEIGTIQRAYHHHHHEDSGDKFIKIQQHRMYDMANNVVNHAGRRMWSYVFTIFFVVVFGFFLAAQQMSQQDSSWASDPIHLLNDFYYPPQTNTLAYPTCSLSKGFNFPGEDGSDLGDYAVLSAMAYRSPEVNRYILDKWFGNETVIDNEQFVSNYRQSSQTDNIPVYFKLYTFPSHPEHAIVSIRGSITLWDFISDMRLYSAAALAQLAKWTTPFGWLWSPILPDLIYVVNLIESETILNVDYYKVTTQFVHDILNNNYNNNNNNNNYTQIQLTGHSLGGGIAMITGAQTNTYAVAISGVGATLSRKTFDPPITLDQLNAYTFDFIPDHDVVAHLGGRARFVQEGICGASSYELFGCHDLWRTICEISYQCGSRGRPVPCSCVKEFGYPMPVSLSNSSFEEACEVEEVEWCRHLPCDRHEKM